MEHTFQFELLTPEGILMRDAVSGVIAPGQEGYFGVLPRHELFATTLRKGVLTVKWQDKTRCYEVTGGIIQVTPDKVVVCAERAALQEIEDR